MSDEIHNNSGSGSGNGALAFILGGVVVALAVIGWFVLGGENPVDEPDLRIELPDGSAIEGEVEGSGQ
ncbi:hypothetical protein [Leisingera daeponensis]|uniref:hypothetical protein n=1 Tax=Leisingera daeponensis TaxID=405746 RepID=UPI001C9431EA|nr:hypothetical protein [Leisingera daeponensis]MBY6055777.1 hypothetical protein [Leisingera daeponensis]